MGDYLFCLCYCRGLFFYFCFVCDFSMVNVGDLYSVFVFAGDSYYAFTIVGTPFMSLLLFTTIIAILYSVFLIVGDYHSVFAYVRYSLFCLPYFWRLSFHVFYCWRLFTLSLSLLFLATLTLFSHLLWGTCNRTWSPLPWLSAACCRWRSYSHRRSLSPSRSSSASNKIYFNSFSVSVRDEFQAQG